MQTAGTLTGISGSTDLIKVGLVRKVIASGISIGENGVAGKARVIKSERDLSLINNGEIVVVDKDLLMKIPLSNKIKGILTDQTEFECKKLFKNIEIKISIICNINSLQENILEGDLITLQMNEGVVYKGQLEDEDYIDKYKYV